MSSVELLELLEELEEEVPTTYPEPPPKDLDPLLWLPFAVKKWHYQDSVASYFKCFVRDDWNPGRNCWPDEWEWYIDLLCLLDEEQDVDKVISILHDHGMRNDTLLDYALKALKDLL